MDRIGNRLSATHLLLILLALDLVLLALHIIVEIPIYTDQSPIFEPLNRQMFLLTVDGGYGEWFQYIKFGFIILLLNKIVRDGGSKSYANWGLIFTILLFDDSLKLHESFGRMLASFFTFVAPFNLRLQDIGELLASATLGLILLATLLTAFINGSETFRKRSIDIGLFVFILAFFGVGVDFLGPLSTAPLYRITVGTLEDVGEMISVSFTVYYIYRLAFQRTPPFAYLHEQLPIINTIAQRIPFNHDSTALKNRLGKLRCTFTAPLQKINPDLLIFLSYCGFIAIITWPILGRLGTHIPGDGGDAYVHLWNFEWARDALINWHNPFFTNAIFYPNGVDLYTHNFAWLNIAFWLPLQALLGSEVAYSLAFTAAFVLNAFAGYLLTFELTRQRAVAFVGGLLFGGWQYTLAQSTRPNLVLIGFIPLAMWSILCLTQTVSQPNNRRYLWLTVFFVAALGITRIQLFVMSLVLLVPWTVRCLTQLNSAEIKTTLKRLIPALILAGLIILPTILPIIWYQLSRDFPQDMFEISRTKFTDLTAYVLPYTHHPLLGKMSEPYQNPLIKTFFIGVTPFVLFFAGLFEKGRLRSFLLILTLVLLVLAIGDRLVINNSVFFDMPYTLIKASNLDEFIGNPTRFNAILGLPFCLLATYGVARWFNRIELVFRPILIFFLTILIIAEARMPYKTLSTDAPIWYETLAREEGDFGILPFPHARRFSETYMNYQRLHGKGIVEGHVSRLPREASAFIQSVPLLSYLAENYVFAQETLPPENLDNISEQFQLLADVDIRYFVLHKQFLHSDIYGKWREWIAVEPIWEDEETLVFSTDLNNHVVVESEATNDIALLQTVNLAPDKRSNQTSIIAAHWLLEDGAPIPDTLCLNVASFDPICDPFSPPLTESNAPQIVLTRQRLFLEKYIQAGDQAVFGRFFLNGTPVAPTFQFTTIEVAGPPRQFEPPFIDNSVVATFGDEIVFLGYSTPQLENDQLNLTVYWQALVEKSQSVQYFLHIFDSEGNLVAQADAVPRNWTYPTTEWAEGELVDDSISIDFSQQPTGQYSLSIGLVNVETLERVNLISAENNPLPDNTLPLGTFEK